MRWHDQLDALSPGSQVAVGQPAREVELHWRKSRLYLVGRQRKDRPEPFPGNSRWRAVPKCDHDGRNGPCVKGNDDLAAHGDRSL